MSKLASLLRRASRSEPAPIGFAARAGRAKTPGLLVTGALDEPDAERALAAVREGADRLLLSGDLGDDADALRSLCGAAGVPCGLRLKKPAANSGARARNLGLDFLSIEDDDAPAAALLDEETGFVLAVDGEVSDTFLRTLDTMPFDALDAGEIGSPFTIRRQLELRGISGFARKPLLVRAGDSLTSEDLECLRDAGVGAVVVEAVKAGTKRTTKTYRLPTEQEIRTLGRRCVVVQADVAALVEQQHRRSGELLARRGDVEDGVGGQRHPMLQVGHAVVDVEFAIGLRIDTGREYNVVHDAVGFVDPLRHHDRRGGAKAHDVRSLGVVHHKARAVLHRVRSVRVLVRVDAVKDREPALLDAHGRGARPVGLEEVGCGRRRRSCRTRCRPRGRDRRAPHRARGGSWSGASGTAHGPCPPRCVRPPPAGPGARRHRETGCHRSAPRPGLHPSPAHRPPT